MLSSLATLAKGKEDVGARCTIDRRNISVASHAILIISGANSVKKRKQRSVRGKT